MEEMMSICLTRFPNCLVLGEPNIYQNLGDFSIIGDFTLRSVNLDFIVEVIEGGWF